MRTALAWAAPVSIALATLALYVVSLPPTVTLEDAGFFLLAARDAGVNHPPGYPLYALLSHAFTWLPASGGAIGVELLSALLGAAACALLFVFARSIGLGAVASALAAGAFGVSSAFWSQAIIPEVYTLNALLCFATFACCRRAVVKHADAALFAGALFAGLGLANHWPLCVLSWPGAALLLWPMRRRVVRRSPWLLAALLAPPLVLYSWMVWRSQQEGVVAFLGPIDSLHSVARYVLRRIYSEQDLARGPDLAQVAQLAGFYAQEALRQFGAVGAALAALGFVWQWRRLPREVALALCWICFGTLGVLIATQEFRDDFLSRSIVRVYPLVAWGVLALWLGVGFDALAQHARSSVPRRAVLTALAAGLFVWLAASHWRENDRRTDRWALRYASAVLEALPPDAVLFTSDDTDSGPIGFAKRALGLRPDVDVYNDMGLVFPNRIVDSEMPAEERDRRLAEFVRAAGRPVFAIYDWKLPGLPARPYGLFYEVTPGIVERRAVTLSAQAALEELVFTDPGAHPWNRFHRDRLVAAFAHWVAVRLERTSEPVERAKLLALRERLAQRFTGQLALIAFALRREPPDVLWRSLDELTGRLPGESDVTAADRAALFHLRGMLYRREGREDEAGLEFERAVDALPKPYLNTLAIGELLEHYNRSNQPERAAALLRRLGVPEGTPLPAPDGAPPNSP